MTVVCFCGPTLPVVTARALLPEAEFLPPAECGDLYLACKRRPRAIALIDGYFDHRLAVWHKEVLWALSLGIAVYGAASMGALRAAELSAHGMIGVGEIYAWYRSGEVEDDDEVAVVHEPAEREYRVRSEAMVNIRATLRAARRAAVIDSGIEAAVVAAGKALYYPERSFSAAVAAAEGLSERERSALVGWLREHGLVDQKRLDALALIDRIKADLAQRHPPRHPVRPFVTTCYWDMLKRSVDSRGEASTDTGVASEPVPKDSPAWEYAEQLLQQVTGGAPDLRIEVELAATERALAILIGEQAGYQVTPEEAQAASELVRKDSGALTPLAVATWLAENRMNLSQFSALARDEVLMDRFADQARTLAAAQVPAVLRLLGVFRPADRSQ